MKSFAAAAVLAIAASAIKVDSPVMVEEEVTDVIIITDDRVFEEVFDVLPDEEIAVAMVQGTGRDHTDWSWYWEHQEAKEEKEDALEDVVVAEEELAGAIVEYEDVLHQIISPQVEHQRNCQLHREEEINLYYQCTQNDINNYALHHFGGEVRSYPRWVEEYNVCIDHIHSAKTLHLDYYWPDGHTTLEPCNPQDHASTVYIHGEPILTGYWPEHTIISANPLDPYKSCDMQSIPNWGGIWVETHALSDHKDILMGKVAIDETYTMRCYTIQDGGDRHKAKMLETWDEPNAQRTYDVELAQDNRSVENGCMIKTHLHGTSFTQWITGVGFKENMNFSITEDWYVVDASGHETFNNSHNELRVGSCQASADGSHTEMKRFIPGVIVKI
jgi:hypothetical protein